MFGVISLRTNSLTLSIFFASWNWFEWLNRLIRYCEKQLLREIVFFLSLSLSLVWDESSFHKHLQKVLQAKSKCLLFDFELWNSYFSCAKFIFQEKLGEKKSEKKRRANIVYGSSPHIVSRTRLKFANAFHRARSSLSMNAFHSHKTLFMNTCTMEWAELIYEIHGSDLNWYNEC